MGRDNKSVDTRDGDHLATGHSVAMPGAAWTRGAKAVAKNVLEPILREMDFTGTFPRYRRSQPGQVCLVEISVRVRTGLLVELLSLPPRSKQGTWRSKKLRKAFLAVPSTSDVPVLSRKLIVVSRKFRREALAFWRISESYWSRDARSAREIEQQQRVSIARAMLDGDARKLAAMAGPRARLGADEFVNGLASVDFRWNDEAANRGIWKCADVLIEYDPPKDEIAASLVVSAIEHLSTKADVKSRPLAKRVLDWGRPHVRGSKRLANQIAHVARAHTYEGNCELAAALFQFILDGKDSSRAVELDAVKTACALFCVLSANRREPPEVRTQKSILSCAIRAFPKDRYVRFNAACVSAELGDAKGSVDHLLAALKLGIDPKVVMTQRGLNNVSADARIARALRGVRAGKAISSSAAGLLPP